VNARKIPDAIIVPKIPEKPPRSRRWNQWALTLTMLTAPNDWKYMFTAYKSDSTMTMFEPAPSPDARSHAR
jgi:hypothetical protein